LLKSIKKEESMEGGVSKLSKRELEERIRELEHTYAEFFSDEADVNELHLIRKRIMELQKRTENKRNDH
jgi:hypothetical protein